MLNSQPAPLPPVNRKTHRCKNITLPQTSFAGGKNHGKIQNLKRISFTCLSLLGLTITCDGMVISPKSADKLFVTFYLPSPAPKSWSLRVPLCWFEEGIPGDSLSVLCLFRPICPGKFPYTLLWPMKPCRALFVPKSFVRSSSVFGRENKIEHSHDV